MTPTNPGPDVSRREDEETAALWRACKRDGDGMARQRLVHLYYPLVKHVARGLASSLSRQADLDDLEGYGAEGLIDAVDKYDPDRGVRFPTFAAHRIRGAIYDGIRASDWVPRSVRRKARELQEVDAELAATQGRAPTEEEEAAALDVKLSVLRASKAQIAAAQVASLDLRGAMTSEVAAPDEPEPLSAYLAEETRSLVQTAMYRLPDRERAVAAMSFGEGMTLSEIGRTLGVTESRVCQIRANALSRLRIYMTSQGMGPEGTGEQATVAPVSRAG